MSIRACEYALEVAAGPPARRAILFALAIRANGSCGCTFGGDWLATAAGVCTGSVRRHLDELERDGAITLKRRRGRAHVVRFPIAAFIHNPAHQCAGCNAWNERSPRALLRETPRTAARNPAQQCAPYLEENLEKPAELTALEPRLTAEQITQILRESRKQA